MQNVSGTVHLPSIHWITRLNISAEAPNELAAKPALEQEHDGIIDEPAAQAGNTAVAEIEHPGLAASDKRGDQHAAGEQRGADDIKSSRMGFCAQLSAYKSPDHKPKYHEGSDQRDAARLPAVIFNDRDLEDAPDVKNTGAGLDCNRCDQRRDQTVSFCFFHGSQLRNK
jgi:hypothetical protein